MQAIQKLGASLGGKAAGELAVKTGSILMAQKKGARPGGIAATHIRWHIKRDVYRPDVCPLCAEMSFVE
jgi:hypothetical protein